MRWWIWVACLVGCKQESQLKPDAAPDAPVCPPAAVISNVEACAGIGYGLPVVGVGAAHVMSSLADVNGDSKLDLIAPVLASDGGVSVALGNGDGTFASPITYAAGDQPVGVAVGDLDGDGAADLAVVSQAQGEDVVFVLMNQGNGTFSAPTSLSVGAGPRAVVIGDLEPDGDQDIVVASFSSDSVTILRNTGAGSFAAPTALTVTDPWRLALGRLDTDTHDDLVVVGFSSTHVFKNAGDGTFPAATAYSVVAGDLAIGDWNGDGEGDVALSNSAGITMYAGKGNAVLEPATGASFGGANALTAGDFDGNGKLDLAAVGRDNVTLLLRGETTFTQTTYPLQAMGNEGVTSGDIDGDGDLDLAIASIGNRNNGITLLRNPGDAKFLASTLIDSTAAYAIGRGDLDGDGRDDVIYADGIHHLRVYVNGALTADHDLGSFAYAISVADVTRDGKPDAIVSTDRDVHVFAGQGGGALAPAGTYPTGVESFGMSVVDLDDDGALDIVVPHPIPPASTASVSSVGILHNNGDGTFRPQQTYATGSSATAAAIADFNGDCKLDIVIASQLPYQLELLPGVGDATFGPSQRIWGDYPTAVATADADGDAKSDLVVLTGKDVVVLRGHGDGTFEQSSAVPTILTTGSAPMQLVDFDGDARYDVVVVNDVGLAVHRGQADGSFGPPRVFNLPGQPSLVGDLDGDRRIDVLALSGGHTQDDWRLYKVLGSCAP